MTVMQPSSRTATLIDADFSTDSSVLNIQTFPTDNAALGSIYSPFISGINDYYLTSGRIGEFSVSQEEFNQFLRLEDVPVRVDGTIQWSSDVLDHMPQ
jgi:hypothetical protein